MSQHGSVRHALVWVSMGQHGVSMRSKKSVLVQVKCKERTRSTKFKYGIYVLTRVIYLMYYSVLGQYI